MRDASAVATEAVELAHALWAERGLTDAFKELVDTVWTKNVERHEPVELGDDANTLGYNCSRNLMKRARRRLAGTDHQSARWDIEGLAVDLPQGALRLTLAGRRFYIMKAAPAHGLNPDWDSLVNWDNESNTRQQLAEATRVALHGYTSPAAGQLGLWPFPVDTTPHSIRDFLVVWAGEQTPVTTAGWMTLPVHGESPFAAVRPLWSPRSGAESAQPSQPSLPTGPSFELQPAVTPSITLRPRTAEEHQS